MNAYKEIEKIVDFQMHHLKKILDELPIYEIVERTENKLVVRQEAKNCISMQELIKNWEMVEEAAGLITFQKMNDSEKTYEDRLYSE